MGKSEWSHLYKTSFWRATRKLHLAAEPVCRFCRQAGRVNDGTRTMAGGLQPDHRRQFLVVDHIVPHRGDLGLFRDRANLQTLCPDHHDTVKQREEVRGFTTAAGSDGWPLDPAHPANR